VAHPLETGTSIEVKPPAEGPPLRYIVKGLRAKGGQGLVYALTGEQDELAVLKVPTTKGLVSTEVERRILEELPAHQNLVRLLGTARIQGVECPVLAWAFENPFLRLNHASLEAITKPYRGLAPRTALPATTAIEVTFELLCALEHMHNLGFVHGDIKSSNVLIQMDFPSHTVSGKHYFSALQQRAYSTCLVDFGSTRSTAFLESMDQNDEAIAPSEFTPLYAPPEIFKGVGTSRGGKFVDVYQVGVLLYQWISGHPPYDTVLPAAARQGYTNQLVDVKRAEREGKVRPFDPRKLKGARQHDVVFAEAFAAQRLRDRFYEDLLSIVDFATSPDPQARPSVTTLKQELIRLFELEEPREPRRGVRFTATRWNPRWHLTRTNRLSEAARASEAAREAAGAGSAGGSGGSATGRSTRRPMTSAARPSRESTTSGRRPAAADDAAQARPAGGSPTARGPQPAGAPGPGPATGGGQRSAAAAAAQAQSGQQGSSGPATTSGPRPGEARRVALIDDDKVALAILGRALRRRGFAVRTFQDPESALDVICHDQPHAVIVDMEMRGLNGLQLLRELERRLNGRPFPALILSSVEDENTIKESYRQGVMDYLVKPVTEGELAVKLEKAIADFADKGRGDDVPRELSGFELLEEVRRGEVAVVFRAADMWNRYPDVMKSVKVLRPDLAGDALPLLKLRREIDTVALCQHRGIVKMHSSGILGRLLFYVTDVAPPETLGEWVRAQRRLEPDQTVTVVHQLASALEHLHQRNLILGDLTPETVGMTEEGQLVIMELGHVVQAGGVPREDLPPPPKSRYAAPEWFDEQREPDARADLYSLGVVALEAFAGRPLVGRRGAAAPDVSAFTSGLPAPIADLLSSMVSPLPDRRPATIGAVLDVVAS
jgi:serine/threonine protein kinase/ActR/RegA family two-component response regulator